MEKINEYKYLFLSTTNEASYKPPIIFDRNRKYELACISNIEKEFTTIIYIENDIKLQGYSDTQILLIPPKLSMIDKYYPLNILSIKKMVIEFRDMYNQPIYINQDSFHLRIRSYE